MQMIYSFFQDNVDIILHCTRPIPSLTVDISCGNLIKSVTKRNIQIQYGTKLVENFFGPNWIPDNHVDEEGNLTFSFKLTGI